jgi:hypothetical protein
VALATEHGFMQWAAQGTILRARVLVTQGHATEAMAQIQQGLTADRGTGSELLQPYFLALLSATYRSAGKAEAGLPVLAEALRRGHDTGECWYQAELYRLKGKLLLEATGGRSQSPSPPLCGRTIVAALLQSHQPHVGMHTPVQRQAMRRAYGCQCGACIGLTLPAVVPPDRECAGSPSRRAPFAGRPPVPSAARRPGLSQRWSARARCGPRRGRRRRG